MQLWINHANLPKFWIKRESWQGKTHKYDIIMKFWENAQQWMFIEELIIRIVTNHDDMGVSPSFVSLFYIVFLNWAWIFAVKMGKNQCQVFLVLPGLLSVHNAALVTYCQQKMLPSKGSSLQCHCGQNLDA